MTDYDILGSSLVLAGCLAKRKHTTINRRVQKKIGMEQFHHFGTVFAKEDRVTAKVAKKPCFFIAKFHYTDPTRTKSAHIVGDELNSTTRTRHGPTRTRPDPRGPARTFFAAKLRWPVRVRSGPCSGI